jgi:hypothetical protein
MPPKSIRLEMKTTKNRARVWPPTPIQFRWKSSPATYELRHLQGVPIFRVTAIASPHSSPAMSLDDLIPAFLKPTTADEAASFLNRTGIFCSTWGSTGKAAAGSLGWDEFQKWQGLIREARYGTLSKLWAAMKLDAPIMATHPRLIPWLDKKSFFICQTFSTLDAMIAVLFVDSAAGVRYGRCEQCDSEFARTTSHKKTFCSQECGRKAHRARVRNPHQAHPKKDSARTRITYRNPRDGTAPTRVMP